MSGQLFPTNHLLTKMKILTRRVPPPAYTRNSYSPACLLPFFWFVCFFVVVSLFLIGSALFPNFWSTQITSEQPTGKL